MSDEISLLPDELRKKEETIKHPGAPVKVQIAPAMDFSVPKEEAEDIEIIEIDEGEIEQVLESEPFLTRVAFKLTMAVEDIKARFFGPQVVEAPPKLPPQFFTPPPIAKPGAKPEAAPAPGVVPAPIVAAVTEAGKPAVPAEVPLAPAPALAPIQAAVEARARARITPYVKGARRVRVIRRIRKPVRVSFVSEEELRVARIDVSRRQFTFITIAVLGGILLGGSAYLLKGQYADAASELQKADKQLAQVRDEIRQKNQDWSSFQDLEPKLRALTGLLRTHVSTLRLLDQIEKNTLPTVSYQSFALGADRRVNLAVVADSFNTAAAQVSLFEKASFVKKVETSGYTATYDSPDSFLPKSVEFQTILTLSDDALRIATSTVAATP